MIDIKVPTVGESINEVTLLKWTKKEGDYVERDEVIAELESEKATILSRAKAEAEADRSRLLEETEAEIGRLRAQADAEIARIAQISKAGIKRLAAEESIRRAEEKLRARMDVESDSRLVKASIQEIGGLK